MAATPQDPNWEEVECNKRLLREVADEQGLPINVVEKALKHYSDFTAMIIKTGSMEGVFFPFLGKIQVKLRNQQYKAHFHALPKEYRELLLQSAPDDLDLLFKPDKKHK